MHKIRFTEPYIQGDEATDFESEWKNYYLWGKIII